MPVRTRKSSTSALTSALRRRHPARFLSALAELDTGHVGVPFAERAEPLGMIGGLDALHRAVVTGGIRAFLDQWEGSGFHQTMTWCRMIGAKRAAAYLEAVAKLYPRGRVPEDDEKRFEIAAKLEEKAYWRGQTDPFRKLDVAYAGAMDEMAECLRAYVRAHADEVTAALEETRPRRSARRAPSKASRERLKKLIAEADKVLKDDSPVWTPVLRKEQRSPEGTAVARLTRFLDAISELSRSQWVTVAERCGAALGAFKKATSEVDFVRTDALMGRLMPKEQYIPLNDRARSGAGDATARLDGVVVVKGKELSLQRLAHSAAFEACQTIILYDWLMASKSGARAGRVLFAPFEGFAPLPGEE